MELICIVCPNGCHLTVEQTGDGMVVTGHKCPKGEAYGREETQDPRRTVTCTAPTDSIEWPCVPVKTEKPVQKKHITGLLAQVYALKIRLPVRRGDVVLDNADGNGARVVATRTLPPDYPED
jgi:CxxC motif-containing protein